LNKLLEKVQKFSFGDIGNGSIDPEDYELAGNRDQNCQDVNIGFVMNGAHGSNIPSINPVSVAVNKVTSSFYIYGEYQNLSPRKYKIVLKKVLARFRETYYFLDGWQPLGFWPIDINDEIQLSPAPSHFTLWNSTFVEFRTKTKMRIGNDFKVLSTMKSYDYNVPKELIFTLS